MVPPTPPELINAQNTMFENGLEERRGQRAGGERAGQTKYLISFTSFSSSNTLLYVSLINWRLCQSIFSWRMLHTSLHSKAAFVFYVRKQAEGKTLTQLQNGTVFHTHKKKSNTHKSITNKTKTSPCSDIYIYNAIITKLCSY